MADTKEKMISFGIMVAPDQDDSLIILASARRTSKSAVIREAIDFYFKHLHEETDK